MPLIQSTKFWKIFFATIAGIVVFSVLLNYIVDPFAIYGTGIFDSLEFNRYQDKYFLLRDFDPKPSALIIGSSRMTFMDPEIVEEITGMRCFVWGCPDARMEIEYAMLRIALEEFHCPVKILIIGVEPEVFHPTKPINPEAKVIDEYTKYFEKSPWWSEFTEKFSRLFTIEQTLGSVKVLIREIQGKESERVFDFRNDGFPLLPDNIYDGAGERIQEGILQYPYTGFGIEEFTGLSEDRKHYFEEILRICDENDIKVYAITTPLHPDLVRRLFDLGARPIFDETAAFVKTEVEQYGGVFRDYTTIESFNGSPDYFLDAYHMTPDNGNILIRDLLSDYERE
ncbi:MAG: hypothetical protein NTY09_04660 [bacterium]|nr:hypothetical protein [bacterium]